MQLNNQLEQKTKLILTLLTDDRTIMSQVDTFQELSPISHLLVFAQLAFSASTAA